MKALAGVTLVLSLILVAAGAPVAPAVATPDDSGTFVSGEDLREDLEILNRALSVFHPGLHRHTDEAELKTAFQQLEGELTSGAPLAQAYLAISHFLARIRCGHTYANFWNQPEAVQKELFGGQDKVPFTFAILDDRIFVLEDATPDDALPRGTEVVSLDGRAVSDVLGDLRQLVRADGSNDGKRTYDLQVTGTGGFEAFDIYQPLAFPPTDEHYELGILRPGEDAPVVVKAVAMTREQRRARLEDRYGARPSGPDDLWSFELLDENTALLRLGSFVTWKMELDWKKFLRESFERARNENVGNLILDLRGNEGGNDAVNLELARYLVTQPVSIPATRELTRYAKVPRDLDPYLDTWNDSIRDISDAVVAVEDGFYARRGASSEAKQLPAGPDAFEGRIYALVDAANSSATFQLASTLKEGNLATLVGQTTGGNRQGINAGLLFFLRLPNSGIEVDLPLIGYFRGDDEPDAGLIPDVVVERRLEDLIQGVDAELEAVRRLIAESQ